MFSDYSCLNFKVILEFFQEPGAAAGQNCGRYGDVDDCPVRPDLATGANKGGLGGSRKFGFRRIAEGPVRPFSYERFKYEG
jgi:hypothetical protein